MELEGKSGRLVRVSGVRGLRLDEYGNLAVSLMLPKYAALAAAGKIVVGDTHAGTAKAPVVAPPTTSPEWGLYNGYEGGGPSLVLLQVSCQLKSGTAGLGLAIFGASAIGAQTAVTSDYASSVKSRANGRAYDGSAYITNNPTLVGGTPAYAVLKNKSIAADDGVGLGLVAEPEGLLMAPPKGMIAVELVGETGVTALFTVSFVWAELELDLG